MTADIRRYTDQLAQLVAQPSVSCAVPRWDMSNRPVLELLAGWLEDLGFRAELLPVPGHDGKFNLLATLGAGPGGLVLAGHSDTVPFDEARWQSDPFRLSEREGKLYGLGATDMKGFFPAVLAAVAGIDPTRLRQPVMVLATADEESSMSGARALAASGRLSGRFAVVGEPTGMRPVNAHKGILMESVRVHGASGHSSNPALGNNALEAMHEITGALLGYRDRLQREHSHPAFEIDVPTLNLGCVHGGDGANRICGECELHFDLRSVPGLNNDQLRRDFQTLLGPIAECRGVDLVFSSLFEGVDPFWQAENAPLIHASEALTGHAAESVAFATEAPFFQKMGLETVVLGPGSINQAHQPDEFIPLDQIDPAVKTLRGLIDKLCIQPPQEVSR